MDKHVYKIGDRTEIVAVELTRVSKGKKLHRYHFGVLVDDLSTSFVLEARKGAILEKAIARAVRRASHRRG